MLSYGLIRDIFLPVLLFLLILIGLFLMREKWLTVRTKGKRGMKLLELKRWDVKIVAKVIEEFPHVDKSLEGRAIHKDSFRVRLLREVLCCMQKRHELDEVVLYRVLY